MVVRQWARGYSSSSGEVAGQVAEGVPAQAKGQAKVVVQGRAKVAAQGQVMEVQKAVALKKAAA